MSFKKLSPRELCQISLFVALIAIMAQIIIPMPLGVPMTMQTFAVPLAGILLGARKGTLAVLIYILIGVFGVPVFAGFTGGPALLVGPTGGFLLSFPLMAWFAGMGAEKNKKSWLIFGLAAGSLSNYFCGLVLYSILTHNNLYLSFMACVFPFIPTAIIKAIAAGILGSKLKKILSKTSLISQ